MFIIYFFFLVFIEYEKGDFLNLINLLLYIVKILNMLKFVY